MQKLFFRVLFTVALAAVLSSRAAAGTSNFDNGKAGVMPEGWASKTTGKGEAKWSLEKDDSAPSAPLVLKQSGWAPNPVFPLCVLANTSLKDGFVEVKLKPLSGTNDQAGGVVWRCRDENNYYVVRANALEDNVVLYKVEQGKRKALDIVGRKGGYGVKTKVPPQEWTTLRVEFAGTRFRVFMNGRELFAVEDATFSDAGTVGVWTKADSITLFDDFTCGSK